MQNVVARRRRRMPPAAAISMTACLLAASVSEGFAGAFCGPPDVTTPVVVTRCSNNYGPRQYPEKLVPLFVTNAIDDEPLPVYGTGLNRRDWLHVDDHCDALLTLLEGRTALVIAHRLSTVRRMDELIILEHGRVVERGTHGALLAGSGIYASLWSHQSGGFLGDGAAENEQGERT